MNIYQRNFKYFNEREFQETLNGINWDNILPLNASDPNLSMNNFYNQINILLDEVAPYKKLTKKERKLKSIDIQHLMQKRDKLHHKYCQESNKTKKEELYINYKKLRNNIVKYSKYSKTIYYKNFFEANKNNSSKIWEGIRTIVNLNGTSKRDIKIIDQKGKIIIDQQCIANYFNQYFVEIGLKADRKISHTPKNFHDYLTDINCKNTFFLRAVNTHEILEIILTFDSNKSTGPNSSPIYILKAFNNFFSSILCTIINLVFETVIFPDLWKLAKVIPIYKKDDALLCVNYRPISLLFIFSNIFEKWKNVQICGCQPFTL